MSNDDQTQPVHPGDPGADPSPAAEASLPSAPAATPVGDTTAQGEPVPAASGRRGFRERLRSVGRSNGRDRTFGLAALIASALAGIIVGGLGVATVAAVTDGHDGDRGGWIQRRDGDRDGGFRGRDGRPGPQRGGAGLAPSITEPDDTTAG